MSDNKYTSEDLKIMQSWPLERKIQVTQTRIIEWYQKNDGKVVWFNGNKEKKHHIVIDESSPWHDITRY